jgi:adenylyl-sulfate kinase
MAQVVILLTGLSGAGKSTIANIVAKKLVEAKKRVEVLDGDELRLTLSRTLGFSKEHRLENMERIMFVAALLAKHDVITLVPIIAPYQAARTNAQAKIKNYLEIYVEASLDAVIKRDVKGLYKKALSGELKGFTGIDDPYETPLSPDLTIKTEQTTPQEAAQAVLDLLKKKNFL